MTDTTDTTDAENAQGGTPAGTQPESAGTPAPEAEGGNREAAKWRRQLRDAEAERDAARDLVAKARAVLLAQAAEAMELDADPRPGETRRRPLGRLQPGALADTGIDPADLFDGMELDRDKLRDRLAEAAAVKPYLFDDPRRRGNVAPTEGAPKVTGTAGSDWAAAFGPHER